ncbi:hypothetical protein D3C86_1852330 [compost metagenome]
MLIECGLFSLLNSTSFIRSNNQHFVMGFIKLTAFITTQIHKKQTVCLIRDTSFRHDLYFIAIYFSHLTPGIYMDLFSGLRPEIQYLLF